MNEPQVDVNEASSDLETDLDENLDQNLDEIAESSTAQDVEPDSSTGEEEEGTIKLFESEKANLRFSEITNETKEVKAENAAIKAEAKALRDRLAAMESAEVPAFDEAAPTLDQFDYDQEAYNAKLVAHEAAKAAHNVLSKNRKASKEAIEAQAKQALFEQHTRKREALQATQKDLVEVISSTYLNIKTEGGNATAEAILRAENGADIEYHVAKNPELAVRLSSMDQFAAIGEVARLSEQLKVKPKKRDPLPEPVGATPSGGGRTQGFQPVFSSGATFE